MIKITNLDIGRKVLFENRIVGIITSFNEKFVFVKFGNNCTNQACKREQLKYLFVKND